MRKLLPAALALILPACASTPPAQPAVPDGSHAHLAVLETTDLHSNVLSYNYIQQKDDPSLGYERTATLIRRARAEFPNTVLFDNGDAIQGTELAEYQAKVKPIGCDQELAMYQAMDQLHYDGGTAGNHEFNYGLPFLSQVTGTPMNVDAGALAKCAGPHFPLVLANVASVRDGQPIFQPWTVVTTSLQVEAPGGARQRVPLRIGIIGFTPPPIIKWDKPNLEGKVTVSGILDAAQKYLPQLQAQHPDLIVALMHGGLDTHPYTTEMENAGWYLAGVPGIDVLLLGHTHTQFPGPRYAGLKDVDAQRGFVRGVPAVMGGFFGKDLGVVNLALVRRDGRWTVDPAQTHSEVRPICPHTHDCVPADPAIAPLIAQAHAATVAYGNTPIGSTSVHLSSYFADEGEPSALAVVNAAQADYVRRELPKTHPELASVPVLSATAAFRTGFGGPSDYTDVPPGPLTLHNATDLYYSGNTLAAVKVDGTVLRAWLEYGAERFNRIDPASPQPQALIGNRVIGYDFDQIQAPGLHYTIDPSQPVGQRIVALTWQGRPVDPAQPFIVVTSNSHASGGHFPGLDGNQIVLASLGGTREIVTAWLRKQGLLDPSMLPPRSWNFAPLVLKAPLTFTSASGKQALAEAAGLRVRQLEDHGDGTATYSLTLAP